MVQEDEFKLFLPDPAARQTPTPDTPTQDTQTPDTPTPEPGKNAHETNQPETQKKNTHETNKMLLVATAAGIFALLELFVF